MKRNIIFQVRKNPSKQFVAQGVQVAEYARQNVAYGVTSTIQDLTYVPHPSTLFIVCIVERYSLVSLTLKVKGLTKSSLISIKSILHTVMAIALNRRPSTLLWSFLR